MFFCFWSCASLLGGLLVGRDACRWNGSPFSGKGRLLVGFCRLSVIVLVLVLVLMLVPSHFDNTLAKALVLDFSFENLLF